MGVVSIHNYPLPEGKTGQQASEGICKIIEALGGIRAGNFSVDCESFHSTPSVVGLGHSKTINVFHDSEHPASAFALIDSGQCLVAENSLDNLMNNISTFYQAKKSSKMDCKGPKYTMGDFTVKVGSVSMGSSFRGILIEVEYEPCVVPSQCWDLMKEFMGGFMKAPRDPHPFLQSRMNDLFSPVDTIQQYNDHFNSFRKQTGLSSANTSLNSSLLNTSLSHANSPMIKTERWLRCWGHFKNLTLFTTDLRQHFLCN